MPLSQKDAVDAARSILAGPRTYELARLDAIAAALRPNIPAVSVPDRATQQLKDLARKSRTNYLPLVLNTTSQLLKVEGYRGSGSGENSPLWDKVWQRNQLDSRQTGIHRTALKYGASYTTTLPGKLDGGEDDFPLVQGFSPRQMTAVYQNPSRDEWPMLALDVDGKMLRLFDEECVYYLGAENGARSAFAPADVFGMAQLEYIETRTHGLGVCPVTRFRDLMLLEGEEQMGIIEPIVTLQERIDETVFGMLVTQFFAAFKQRYVIGWTPETEDEKLKASASQLWTFKDLPSEVSVGELSASDPSGYLRSHASGIQDMSAIAQVPPTSLGVAAVSNVSAEALAAFQDSSDKQGSEFKDSLGESHEQNFRLAARILGDEAAATDFAAQVRWKDTTARSLAQTTDALTKWVTGLEVPVEYAWTKLPDISDQDLELMARLREKAQAEAQAKFEAQQKLAAEGVKAPAGPDAPKKPNVQSLPAL